MIKKRPPQDHPEAGATLCEETHTLPSFLQR